MKNNKIKRLLNALAVELKDLSDVRIQRIHEIIRGEFRDEYQVCYGYDYDFRGEVESCRVRIQGVNRENDFEVK